MSSVDNVRIIVATEEQSNVVDDMIRELIENMKIELTLEQQVELHEKMRDVFMDYIEDKLIYSVSDEEIEKIEVALDEGTLTEEMFADSVEKSGINIMDVIHDSVEVFKNAFYVSVDHLEEATVNG